MLLVQAGPGDSTPPDYFARDTADLADARAREFDTMDLLDAATRAAEGDLEGVPADWSKRVAAALHRRDAQAFFSLFVDAQEADAHFWAVSQ